MSLAATAALDHLHQFVDGEEFRRGARQTGQGKRSMESRSRPSGRSHRRRLREHGINVDVEADPHTISGLVEGIRNCC